jgi:hypothetical protein
MKYNFQALDYARKILPGADLYDFVDKMGFDAIAIRFNIKTEKIDENTIRDENGTIRKKTTQDYFEPSNQVTGFFIQF